MKQQVWLAINQN